MSNVSVSDRQSAVLQLKDAFQAATGPGVGSSTIIGRPINELMSESLDILRPILRDYQLDACTAAVRRTIKTLDPLLLQLATGAGKSWVLVGLSFLIKMIVANKTKSAKKILVICPTPLLVKQNAEKYIEVGVQVSIYCDKLGSKDTTHDIILGTPVSVLNGLDDIDQHEVCSFFLDECQGISESIRKIVNRLKRSNPQLREFGVTATPYRLHEGYIYRFDLHNGIELDSNYALKPYYSEKVYEVKAPYLIERGFLTPPRFERISDELVYEISGLQVKNGKYTKSSESKVFIEGKHQQTALVITDIMERTKDRKSVLVFAQNIAHANLLFQSFPPGIAAATHSEMENNARDEAVENFKSGAVKFLVNVQSLTVGFDAPMVDAIAVLRLTESIALFEQIVGRGLRLFPGKIDCLILDYCKNMENHCPDGDPFAPLIMARKSSGLGSGRSSVDVACPKCSHVNRFQPMAELPLISEMNEFGYLVTADTKEYLVTRSDAPTVIAAHHGSRCTAYRTSPADGKAFRCDHTWSNNHCGYCGQLNSNQATFCLKCTAPLKASSDLLAQFLGPDTDDDDEALDSASDRYFGPRVAIVHDVRWTFRQTSKGKDAIVLKVSLKQVPYVTKTLAGRLIAESPEPEQLTFWLSPFILHASAVAQWKLFTQFFYGREVATVTECKTLPPVASLNRMIYRKTDARGAKSDFYEIVKLLGSAKR